MQRPHLLSLFSLVYIALQAKVGTKLERSIQPQTLDSAQHAACFYACNAFQAEVDAVLEGKAQPTFTDFTNLRYVTRCVCESMRLYPHPPVLLRRATMPDVLPGGYEVSGHVRACVLCV